jgi:hypothetical protein
LEVEDLGSTNGTKVNGTRVTEQRLQPGDKIGIAKHTYEISYEPAKLGGDAPAEGGGADDDAPLPAVAQLSRDRRRDRLQAEAPAARGRRRRRSPSGDTPCGSRR